jgi:hypothetical protein
MLIGIGAIITIVHETKTINEVGSRNCCPIGSFAVLCIWQCSRRSKGQQNAASAITCRYVMGNERGKSVVGEHQGETRTLVEE